jgi:predicted ribosomally synthesized peptide with nif11-like leader
MTVEQARAFIEKLNSDENLLKQVNDAANNAARLELAKSAGFNFSADEMNSVISKLASEELTEDELDAVAGGGVFGKLDIIGDFSRKWKIEEGESFTTYIDKHSPDLL